MKKVLCTLSALAVLILSGCSSAPSEAPLFEKFTADGTSYPVKIVWQEMYDGYDEAEAAEVTSTYYIASPDKWYISCDFGDETVETLYDNGIMYSMMPEEATAFASAVSDEESSAAGRVSIGYIPSEPEKWALTEKGEAQYEGKTYLYETATLNNEYFLTIYADPVTNDIKYISDGQGEEMAEFVEITHSFDLRIFDIPDDYEIVKIPSAK